MLRSYRRLALLLLFALALGGLPTAPALARSSAQVATPPQPQLDLTTLQPDAASAPAVRMISPLAPIADPGLPALGFDIQVGPESPMVGETVVVSITVTNAATVRAEDLEITLPVPREALALDGPGFSGPDQGWRWSIGLLDGQASTTVTARLRLVRMPRGQALMLAPRASARGLNAPVVGRGGVLVSAPERGPVQADFLPGRPAELRSRDGRLTVRFPGQGYARGLTLQYTPLADRRPSLIAQGTAVPPDLIGFKRGFGTFFLDATDQNGATIHQFDKPLSITVSYTPEQLEALRISEGALTLFWFDEGRHTWVPLPTTIDPATQTATATVDHFTPFQLGDGSSPSTTFVPSLQGWQTDLLTGAASYSFPIEVPAGPAGLKPQLALTYNSASADGDSYKLTHKQSGWAGMGWNLSTGAISLNKLGGADTDYFSLDLNGRASTIVRGGQLSGSTYSTNHLQGWYWYPTDENFIKIRAIENGTFDGQTRYKWMVWTTDGMYYEFADDQWWGVDACNVSSNFSTYKWLLTLVRDPYGNTIQYNYDRISVNSGTCSDKYVHPSTWPTEITWGNAGNHRYKVVFDSAPRLSSNAADGINAVEDMEWDYATNQYLGQLGAPHETRKLRAVQVYSKQSSAWELVREYRLDYEPWAASGGNPLYSDAWTCTTSCDAGTGTGFSADTGYRKLTLKSITRVGKYDSGQTAPTLPPMTFTYQTSRGSLKRANGGWNRLQTVDNGQGGTLTFGYENLSQYYYTQGKSYWSIFMNRHRVTTKTVTDGRGNSGLTTYNYDLYGAAAMNSLGTNLGTPGPNTHPNSATLYYSYANSALADLAVKEHKEFRGHTQVVERTYNGATTSAPLLQEIQHDFIQGGAGCTPTAATTSDSCFVSLRKQEFFKGREWKTVWRNTSGGAALKEVIHTFDLQAPLNASTIDYTSEPARGLWRAFTYESQVEEKTYEGSSTPKILKTVYTYDPAYQTTLAGSADSTHYGNLTQVDVYDETGALYRTTRRWFATKHTESWNWSTNPPTFSIAYLTDRAWAENNFDGQGRLLTMEQRFYDDPSHAQRNTPWYIDTKGSLTRVARYRNVPLQTNAQNVTLLGPDTTYTYDSYGNRVTETTFNNEGTRLFNGSTWSISLPGSSSTARTTTTTYETTFNVFPTSVAPPTVSGVTLTEQGGYDYRMGTLTSATDPNGNTTTAEYDVFGRMTKLIRPGDSSSYPTSQISYNDTVQPVRYQIDLRETAGTTAVRTIQHYYDGLGQEIQIKQESVDTSGNPADSVQDKKYDALGRVVEESTPRYVAITTAYTTPGSTLSNATTTQYDALGRATQITNPDTTSATTTYTLGSYGTLVTVTDANGHKTETNHDVFGRLRSVTEYIGLTGTTTSYTYNELDLLKQVTDAASNLTSIEYDSLGRKTQMTDPDTGTWYYVYDTNGNLSRQRDARGQRLCLYYDALNRLTGKHYNSTSDSCPASPTTIGYSYDDSSAGNQGKGQRTGMTDQSGSTSWKFDVRGRMTQETKTITGSGTYVTQWAYDSADRITSTTYPDGEGVNKTYDAGWRSKSVSGSSTYVQDATYDPLDRPELRKLGADVLRQDYTYYAWTTPNGLGRLQQITTGTPSTPTSLQDLRYTYDSAGNITTINDYKAGSPQAQTFSYDDLNRLLSASASGGSGGLYSESYTYNAIGNLTSKGGASYTYGDANHKHAVTAAGGKSYSYDANGNMLQQAIGGTNYNLNYDQENRPVSFTPTTGFRDGSIWQSNWCAGVGPSLFGGGADFNGDGKDDIWCHDTANNGQTWVALSNGAGGFSSGTVWLSNWCAQNGAGVFGADSDFNGDGKTDIWCHDSVNGGLTWVALSNGAGAFTGGGIWQSNWCAGIGPSLFGGGADFNGDGKDDIWCHDTANNGQTWVALSNGAGGFSSGTVWLSNWCAQNGPGVFGADSDFNGDGKTDIWCHDTVVGGRTWVALSNGAGGFTDGSPWLSYWCDGIGLSLFGGGADFNGDGKDDIWCHDTANEGQTWVALSNGAGGFTDRNVWLSHWCAQNGAGVFGADSDFNGDGKTDIWCHDTVYGGLTWVALSNGVSPVSGATFTYDGDGNRVKATVNGATTVYVGEYYEESGSIIRKYYYAGNERVAMRSNGTLYYLLGDHLGSQSIVADAAGALVSETRYTPFGEQRYSAGPGQTTFNYTGQRRDSTGLLYYHARYYDPALGRFISPDSVVPGDASGSMDGIALKPLTMDFHEPGFVTQLNLENNGGDEKLYKMGPVNPQALNRYSYVQNNPVKYTDPSGHTWYLNRHEAATLASQLRQLASDLSDYAIWGKGAGYGGEIAGMGIEAYIAQYPLAEVALGGAGSLLAALGVIVASGFEALDHGIGQINELATLIESANMGDQYGSDGVALQYADGRLTAMDRRTGGMFVLDTPFWIDANLPASLRPGVIVSSDYKVTEGNYFFPSDHAAILWRRNATTVKP